MAPGGQPGAIAVTGPTDRGVEAAPSSDGRAAGAALFGLRGDPSPPRPLEDWGDLRVAVWAYPTSITVKAGETLTLYFRHNLTSTVFDDCATYPAGTIVETTCTGRARG